MGGVPSGPGLLARSAVWRRGRLVAVSSFDPFGYGTHIILDGFRAAPESLADAQLLDAALRSIGERMHESGNVTTVSVHATSSGAGGGVSAALVAAESQAAVHAFPELRRLSLQAFSTRSLPTAEVTRAFVERFHVGRYECRVHGRARLLPNETEELERALLGERDYARLRLRDLLRS